MELLRPLTDFFAAIDKDPRIGVSHISLYCALLQCGIEQHNTSPVLIKTVDVMKAAKIAGSATYHTCIRDLHNYGYIRYQPSFNHRKKNKVYLLQLNATAAT